MAKNKYNKKLRYRKHPYLMDTIDFKRFSTIFGMVAVILLIVSLLRLGNYSKVAKSIDFSSVIAFSLYSLVFKPGIYTGKIKAYYRRNYQKVSRLMNFYLIATCAFISRFVIISIFEIVLKDNFFYPFQDIFHVIATPLVALFFLIMMYISFYRDKYSTVREFSDKINYEMMFNNRSYQDSFNLFYTRKDKEHEIKEFDGTFYDYEEELERLRILEDYKNKEIKNNENTLRREMRDNNDRNQMDERAEKRL